MTDSRTIKRDVDLCTPQKAAGDLPQCCADPSQRYADPSPFTALCRPSTALCRPSIALCRPSAAMRESSARVRRGSAVVSSATAGVPAAPWCRPCLRSPAPPAPGALVGTALGDALGLPAEGLSREAVARRFGRMERFRRGLRAGVSPIAAGRQTAGALAPARRAKLCPRPPGTVEQICCSHASETINDARLDFPPIPGAELLLPPVPPECRLLLTPEPGIVPSTRRGEHDRVGGIISAVARARLQPRSESPIAHGYPHDQKRLIPAG